MPNDYCWAMAEARSREPKPAAVLLQLPGEREEDLELRRNRRGRYVLPKGVQVTTARQPRSARKHGGRPVKDAVAFKNEGASSYGPAAVAERLVGLLGNNTVAELLGVAKDRPGRWVRGEGVDPVNRAGLADLEALVGHLLAALTPAQASLWLTGDNAHLGARPIDVFRIHGSGPVVHAIAVHEQGAFA